MAFAYEHYLNEFAQQYCGATEMSTRSLKFWQKSGHFSEMNFSKLN